MRAAVTNPYILPVREIPNESVIDRKEHFFGQEKIMSKLWIPAVIATAVFSANAFADHNWDDEDHCDNRHRHRIERVVMQPVYDEPRVIYQAPPVVYEAPPVVYRERVVYRDRPVYYQPEQRIYERPEPRYYERSASYPSYNANHLMGQAIGAVAGGVIGNNIGNGNGRVVATALGAVVGSVVGGNMAGYGY